MKLSHFLHRWTYLDAEDRICSTCGECQYLYRPPPGWFKGPDQDQLEYMPDPATYWKTCLADDLEKHMAETKQRLEKQALKEETSRARAFELLRTSQTNPALNFCKNCGARNHLDANFCTVCGTPLRSHRDLTGRSPPIDLR
jgi:ribosomal protein L40E